MFHSINQNYKGNISPLASYKKAKSDGISLWSYSNIGISRLSSVEIVLIEEGSEFRLDTTQRLRVAVQQHYHIHHGETLTHQRKQVSKETCQKDRESRNDSE